MDLHDPRGAARPRRDLTESPFTASSPLARLEGSPIPLQPLISQRPDRPANRALAGERLNRPAKLVAAEGCRGKELHRVTIYSPISTQGCHFVRIFVINRPFVAADVFNLGIGGLDCRKCLRQRLEITSVLEPTVPHPYELSAQPPELGFIGFGNAIDEGGDLDTCTVPDGRGSSR